MRLIKEILYIPFFWAMLAILYIAVKMGFKMKW